MLTYLPGRFAAVSWFAVPAALVLTGALASTAAGCAKEGGEPQLATRTPAATRLPVGHGKSTARGEGRNARTMANALGASVGGSSATAALLPSLGASAGRGATAVTPIEALLRDGDRPLAKNGLCPPDMASIDDLYCVDRYEASLVEMLPNGDERAWSPYLGIEGHVVRAVSEPRVYPQAYVSEIQAIEACGRSGKRLCKPREWTKACMGPQKTTYGYGSKDEPRRCNDHGRSPVAALYAQSSNLGDRAQWNWDKMNDAALNQLEGTLARTGEYEGCANDYGVHDMVGNLHEWVADPAGTFQGGYYQDTHENGDGCSYKTMAHAAWYHDYSTGFRCCADVAQ
jgi:sulfatase modifying factor 1